MYHSWSFAIGEISIIKPKRAYKDSSDSAIFREHIDLCMQRLAFALKR